MPRRGPDRRTPVSSGGRTIGAVGVDDHGELAVHFTLSLCSAAKMLIRRERKCASLPWCSRSSLGAVSEPDGRGRLSGRSRRVRHRRPVGARPAAAGPAGPSARRHRSAGQARGHQHRHGYRARNADIDSTSPLRSSCRRTSSTDSGGFVREPAICWIAATTACPLMLSWSSTKASGDCASTGPRFQIGSRKILQVPGDDNLRASLDRGSQHVPVIRVGKLQSVDQRLIAGHQDIPNGCVHEAAEAVTLLNRDLRPVSPDRGEHLVEDLIGPLRLDQA